MTNGKTNLRFLAVLLTLCMVLTLLPTASVAAVPLPLWRSRQWTPASCRKTS